VLKFNRRRRVQERQGLLVTPDALLEAEQECLGDEDQRRQRRIREEARRGRQDEELVGQMTLAILASYPGCPPKEAAAIAAMTSQRGSGRVGRSKAGQALAPEALALAVRAHIRHTHTNYDTLLMTGNDRQQARQIVSPRIEVIFSKWKKTHMNL